MDIALAKYGSETTDCVFRETEKINELLVSGNHLAELPPLDFLSRNGRVPTAPDAHLQGVKASLIEFRGILEKAELEGISLKSPITFTKYWLRQTGYSCPDDFFKTETPDDLVIEGYSADHVQIFRNLTFMKLCGYSLAEIFTYPWPDLFERPQTITQQCISEVEEAMRLNRTIPSKVDVHFMKERYSCDRRIHQVNFRHVAPIREGQRVIGYFVSATGKVLDKPQRHELRFI